MSSSTTAIVSVTGIPFNSVSTPVALVNHCLLSNLTAADIPMLNADTVPSTHVNPSEAGVPPESSQSGQSGPANIVSFGPDDAAFYRNIRQFERDRLAAEEASASQGDEGQSSDEGRDVEDADVETDAPHDVQGKGKGVSVCTGLAWLGSDVPYRWSIVDLHQQWLQSHSELCRRSLLHCLHRSKSVQRGPRNKCQTTGVSRTQRSVMSIFALHPLSLTLSQMPSGGQSLATTAPEEPMLQDTLMLQYMTVTPPPSPIHHDPTDSAAQASPVHVTIIPPVTAADGANPQTAPVEVTISIHSPSKKGATKRRASPEHRTRATDASDGRVLRERRPSAKARLR